MPTPIICTDEGVRQFAESFRHCFSKPQYQYQYFVSVLLALLALLALLLCMEGRTLCGLHRTVLGVRVRSYCGLSRFLNRAPWDHEAMVAAWYAWYTRLRRQLAPVVACERTRLRTERAGYAGRGRLSSTVLL